MTDLVDTEIPTSSRPHVGRTIAVIAAVAVVAVLVFGWGWRTFRANELSGYVADSQSGGTVLHVGYTGYATENIGSPTGIYASGSHSTLDLVDVKPLVAGDAEAVKVKVLLCTGPDDSAGTSGNLTDICPAARPWTAGPMNLKHTFFAIAVTAKQSGVINTTGLQIRFRDGIRRGDQHTGRGARFLVRP